MIKFSIALAFIIAALLVITLTNHPGIGFILVAVALCFLGSMLKDDPLATAVDNALNYKTASSRELFRTHG